MDKLSAEDQEVVRASIWHTVNKIVEEETAQLGVQTTPTYVASLVQLVFDQLVSVGEDLEAFAKHAKRKTILPQDLYMITRKNKQLTRILMENIEAKETRQEDSDSFDDGLDLDM